ncbi:MAG: tetratricopeptide repeat protein [Terrimicrobiaceae bacterium]
MIRRHAGIAALLAITAHTQAAITAPPTIGENPDAGAPSSPAMEEHAAAPAAPTSLSDKVDTSSIPSAIQFDSLETDVEEDLGLSGDRVGEAASVKSMEIEIQQALDANDPALAEKLFAQLMRVGAPTSRKRDAMLRMGKQLEEKQKQSAKAIVVYEQFLANFPDDPESLDILLRLGRLYRNTGANASALNKFYSVLYSSIQMKSGDEYTDSSLRAKMEIAHTHFAAGEYQKAADLYSKIKLLKMPTEEASELAFRMAYLSFLTGDYAKSVADSQLFLDTFPASPLAPEAQYLYIQSLKKLNRDTEAMKETIELLQAGQKYGQKKPAVWRYWQRKTGNEIANELYESGDFYGAAQIYQKLAELSDAPDWRGPAIYQFGLCCERLRHFDRAREAYRYIIDKIPATSKSTTGIGIVGENVATVRDMAEWRFEHLNWLENTEKQVFPLINKPIPGPGLPVVGQSGLQAPTPSAPPTPVQQAANQIATPATGAPAPVPPAAVR